jgi:hypothetical protein
MKFLEGAPVFAVEVRSESDYGPRAGRAMAAKRADYFAADARVWDVDLLSDDVVRVYRASDPERATFIVAAKSPRLSQPCPAGQWRG